MLSWASLLLLPIAAHCLKELPIFGHTTDETSVAKEHTNELEETLSKSRGDGFPDKQSLQDELVVL